MIILELPKRINIRIPNYDYGGNGAYFITVCTKERKKILSNVGATIGRPNAFLNEIQLTGYGKIAEKHINQLNDFYNNISVDRYVIMPDHIHLILSILNGQSGTPVPTGENIKIDNSNSIIARFVSTFKRFCNKEYCVNIWQPRYYDHVIRNQQDYNEVWEYIENNPKSWIEKHS